MDSSEVGCRRWEEKVSSVFNNNNTTNIDAQVMMLSSESPFLSVKSLDFTVVFSVCVCVCVFVLVKGESC